MPIAKEYFQSSPLFEPLLPSLMSFGPPLDPPAIATLNKIVPIPDFTLINQSAKSTIFEDGYEARIFLKHEIPTREKSWHDFFNALVWHRFFNSKRAINQLHFHMQQARHPAKQRLPAENMLTLFDENGAIVIASDPLYLDLIRNHCWHELFWQRREMLHKHLKVIIFGHSIYEKALSPYVGLTAKCLMFVAKESGLRFADQIVADYLLYHAENLHPSLLAPLPILGLPGWWAENAHEEFYKNEHYFRPARLFERPTH